MRNRNLDYILSPNDTLDFVNRNGKFQSQNIVYQCEYRLFGNFEKLFATFIKKGKNFTGALVDLLCRQIMRVL